MSAAEDVIMKLVFGAAPTLKEAQETISYLSAYLSPENFSDLEHSALPAMSQNAVTSIVCDPNVYNAVSQKPEVQAFMQSLGVDLSGTSMDLNPEAASDCYPIDGHPSNGLLANHSQLPREASFPNTPKKRRPKKRRSKKRRSKKPCSVYQEHLQMPTKPLETTPTDRLEVIYRWLQAIYRWLQGIFKSLKDMYQKMKDVVVGMMSNIFDYLKKVFRDTWDAVVGIMTKYVGYLKNLVGCMCGDKPFVDFPSFGLVLSSVIVIITILLKRRYPHFKGFKKA